MTGIDRLRELGNDYAEHSWSEAGKSRGRLMLDIADQIERERACDADTIENVRLIVGGVIDEMEHHILGHEGMEDSPVARWARELRDALKSYTSDAADTQNPSCADAAETADVTSEAQKVTRDPAEDVSMSAYDLLPADEREAIAWVRERGGLDSVKKLLDWVVGHCSTKQQLDFDFWLSGRVMYELGFEEDMADRDEVERRLLARLMPEGCEWPRYESGEPVGFGYEVSRLGEVWCICLYRNGSFALNFRAYSKGERVRRPAVPAADGEPLEAGQMVWETDAESDTPLTVVEVSSDMVMCEYTWKDGKTYRPCYPPSVLTHTKPEIDSWERIEEDARNIRTAILDSDKLPFEVVDERALDLVRRCRALAERERSE